MDQTITLQALIQCGAVIMGAWGFFKVIMEIVKAINARHDKEQTWDKAVEDFNKERECLRDEFNGRLNEQDAKIQQLLSMLCMTLRAQDAILEAFDICMWKELHTFKVVLKRQDHNIWAFMERHGISCDEANWNAIAKRYQRKRDIVYKENSRKKRTSSRRKNLK